ncbi:MAG TPA: outer membrane protein assembly factor BamD [Gammaproteobacteria bacterium]|nr:outer membrane protein assembly factor BamD [Gammaproteobacteria bacterium]
MYNRSFSLIRQFVLLALLTATADPAWAAGVIDSIDIDDSRNPATVLITFRVPMQYVTHAPERRGDELQIDLRSLGNSSFALEVFSDDQQTVVPDRDTKVPLIEGRYEAIDQSRGQLILRFSRKVSYTLYPDSDRRSLRLEVVTRENIVQPPALPKRRARGTAISVPDVNYTEHYVINLESSLKKIDGVTGESLGLGPDTIIYTTRFEIDGRIWTRLRAGFYATRREADEATRKVKRLYPSAWVDYASAEEITAALEQTGKRLAKPEKPPVPEIIPTLPRVPDEKIAELMEQARQAMAKNDLAHAIQLYTKILRYPDNPYRRDALEFLGVARERRGQLAHAIHEYKRYLALYPDGEGAERVAQRLAGITTAREAERPARVARKKRRRNRHKDNWEIFGNLSQFYRRDENSTDAASNVVTQSSLVNDLDLNVRRRSDRYDFRSRFTGSYLYNFLDDGSGDSSNISSLYAEISDRRTRLSARIGRQSRNTGGVLGRFDGLLAGYQLNKKILLNAVAGFPVTSTHDQLKTENQLYGISADLGTFANAWDFNLFYIEQQSDGLLDRRAVGGEARYFDPKRSLLTFVDYDVSYDSLNTLVMLGTWTLADRTIINASIDYRNSPILTTNNALQGQTAHDLGSLNNTFSTSEIRDLAEDRTARSRSITLGASHPLTEKFQISGDLTATKLDDTRASGGVDAVPGTDTEFFYNLQFIGSNLIWPGDVSVFGLRYTDATTSDTASLSLNSRFPFRNVWRFNPRFRLDYRDNSSNDSTQWIAAPSMRIEYRWRKRYRFEGEVGAEWSTQKLPNDTEDTSAWFMNIGYRADF